MDSLKQNSWFKSAIKISLAVGDDANCDVLGQFTGTSEAVIPVHNRGELKRAIKFVSVTASKVGSKSTQAGGNTKTKQEELNQDLQEIKDENDNSSSDDEW